MGKKEEKRKKLYAYVGGLKIAQNAFAKKQAEKKKAYSVEFQQCLERIKKEAYTNINTCTILIWYRLMETNNLTLLLKEPREVTKMEANCLNLIYADLRNEVIKEFGWGEKKLKEIELIQEIIQRNIILQAEGDASQYTFIKIAEEQLQELWQDDSKEDQGKSNLIEIAVMLEQSLKISVKVNECSIAMFYGYIKMAEKLSNKAA